MIHVVPERDLREHVITDDGLCPCLPLVWVNDGEDRMVHNAYDGREVGDVMLALIDALAPEPRPDWSLDLRSKYDHAIHLIRMHWPKAEAHG